MSRLEGSHEKAGNEYAVDRGWKIYKVQFGIRGAPDRMISKKPHGPYFVEWKKPGEEPSEQQKHRHNELREAGVRVVWFDHVDKFRNWIDAFP